MVDTIQRYGDDMTIDGSANYVMTGGITSAYQGVPIADTEANFERAFQCIAFSIPAGSSGQTITISAANFQQLNTLTPASRPFVNPWLRSSITGQTVTVTATCATTSPSQAVTFNFANRWFMQPLYCASAVGAWNALTLTINTNLAFTLWLGRWTYFDQTVFINGVMLSGTYTNQGIFWSPSNNGSASSANIQNCIVYGAVNVGATCINDFVVTTQNASWLGGMMIWGSTWGISNVFGEVGMYASGAGGQVTIGSAATPNMLTNDTKLWWSNEVDNSAKWSLSGAAGNVVWSTAIISTAGSNCTVNGVNLYLANTGVIGHSYWTAVGVMNNWNNIVNCNIYNGGITGTRTWETIYTSNCKLVNSNFSAINGDFYVYNVMQSVTNPPTNSIANCKIKLYYDDVLGVNLATAVENTDTYGFKTLVFRGCHFITNPISPGLVVLAYSGIIGSDILGYEGKKVITSGGGTADIYPLYGEYSASTTGWNYSTVGVPYTFIFLDAGSGQVVATYTGDISAGIGTTLVPITVNLISTPIISSITISPLSGVATDKDAITITATILNTPTNVYAVLTDGTYYKVKEMFLVSGTTYQIVLPPGWTWIKTYTTSQLYVQAMNATGWTTGNLGANYTVIEGDGTDAADIMYDKQQLRKQLQSQVVTIQN